MPFDPYFGNSSDEDLMAMGRAAGYLPAEDTIAPEAPAPMQGGLTPPSAQLQSPAASPASSASSVPSPGGAGVGASYRGFSNDAFNRVSKTQTGLDADMARADQQAAAGANRDAGVLQQGAAPAIDAAKSEAQAHVNYTKAQGEQALVMQRLQDDFAAEEAKINAAATAQSNQAKADYMASLMDFRAAKVDPGQLWKSMSGFDRIGTLATAFVHDFLGAKGIHTSAMDTFNKAVDRNIDAQIQAIKTKGEVSEGFKSLWYMQRNQAASDTEARTRVRGFLLEGAKQQIISNMAQYESALASAQGQAAIAKIDEELSKNLIEVYKHSDANAIQLRNQALEKWKTKVNASLEQQSLNLRANELALKKAQEKGNPLAKYLADITPSGGGKIRYEIIAGSPPKQDEVREQMGALANFDNQVGEFQALSRQVGTIPTALMPKFLQSPDGARLLTLRDAMARNLAYAKSGKQVNESEFKHFRDQLPIETLLTNGSREKIIAQTNELLRNEAYSNIAPFVREIGDNETIDLGNGQAARLRDIQINPHFNAPGEIPNGAPGEAQAINNKNIISPPPPGDDEILRNKANALLRPADKGEQTSLDVNSPLFQGIEDAKSRFNASHPEYASSNMTPGEQLATQVGEREDKNISNSDGGLYLLARQAAGGDKQALDQLKEYASMDKWYKKGGSPDEETAFAGWLINELTPSPGPGQSK